MLRINLVLLALAVVLAVPTWLTLRGDRTVFVDTAEVPAMFPGFTPQNVYGIRIDVPRRGEDGQPLRNADGQPIYESLGMARADADDATAWVLAGQDEPLQGVHVPYERIRDVVLDPIASIRLDRQSLVAESVDAAGLERYGLAPHQAIVVHCFDPQGVALADLCIGADASAGRVGEDAVRGYFVRREGASDVVLYERAIWLVSAAREQWIDRRPLDAMPGDVVEVAIENRLTRADARLATKRVAVARDTQRNGVWVRREGPEAVGAVRNTEVDAFVTTLLRLEIQGYVQALPADPQQRDAALAQFGLADPRIEVEVGLADGRRLRIEVGDQVRRDGVLQNERYLLIDTIPFLLSAGDWVVAALERDPTLWFEPAPRER
ncbi:MAG: DUF4340 domain-containing protein [Planctomycetes bacterium]|nr:DUF4340 domain-containing protein [Planctomycetota bacterium]